VKLDTELSRTMARLAAEHRAARAPLSVERAVLAEFDALRRRRGWGIAAVGAIAAMVLAGAFVGRERVTPRPADLVKAAMPVTTQITTPITAPVTATLPRKRSLVRELPRKQNARQQSGDEPFFAIPYTVPLAPEERAAVVRITLSPSAMAAVGFRLPAIDAGGDTQADVLVGEDGRAHAIRIVGN
jgi:hypothetical protein